MPDYFFANVLTASVAAISSRKLMWKDCSDGDHEPLV